jgi:hypothetical protein
VLTTQPQHSVTREGEGREEREEKKREKKGKQYFRQVT